MQSFGGRYVDAVQLHVGLALLPLRIADFVVLALRGHVDDALVFGLEHCNGPGAIDVVLVVAGAAPEHRFLALAVFHVAIEVQHQDRVAARRCLVVEVAALQNRNTCAWGGEDQKENEKMGKGEIVALDALYGAGYFHLSSEYKWQQTLHIVFVCWSVGDSIRNGPYSRRFVY